MQAAAMKPIKDLCKTFKPFGYRPTKEACSVCGQPRSEVYIQNRWIRPPCGECRRREQNQEFRSRVMAEWERRSGLHDYATLDNFEITTTAQQRGMEATRAFLAAIEENQNAPLALVLMSWPTPTWSGYGTGKTHLASAITRRARDQGRNVVGWVMPLLLAKMRSGYGGGDDDEYKLVREATNCDLLVIDDLGQENGKREWIQEKLFMVVNARSVRGPLVITTNKSKTTFPAHVGGAVFSRLWAMSLGGKFVVDMCGPDWRVSSNLK